MKATLNINGHELQAGDPISLDNVVGYLIIDGGIVGIRTPHGTEIRAGFAWPDFANKIKPASATERQRIDALLEDVFELEDGECIQRGHD